MEHSKELFANKELCNRNLNHQNKYYDEIFEFCRNDITDNECRILYPEYSNQYLKQYLYNLQEKVDRGIITKEEWQKIEDKFGAML